MKPGRDHSTTARRFATPGFPPNLLPSLEGVKIGQGDRVRAWGRAMTAGIAVIAIAVGIAVAPDPGAQSAQAVPAGATWDPGYIVSDQLFYDGGAMSANEVQGFLQSKGGRLASWTQATPTIAADSYCRAYQGSGGERAADIIAKVGAACNISQRAILVTLQKEQSLVTASAPTDWAINHATGFGCPDTAPCNPNVAGFFYQIYYAARQFQVYRLNPYSFNFRVGQTASILYSPNTCNPPSSQVYIRNAATAGLYDYTPYQPYGQGANCQSYGNLNFWTYWWNWFGDPHGGDAAWVDALYQDLLGRLPSNASQTWQNQALLSGMSRDAVVVSIITSPEYRSDEVTAAYQGVLGRAPDAGGLSYWVGQTPPSGGTWGSQIPLSLLQSDELWWRSGGSTEGWVSLMYQQLLGRAPDSSGLIAWSNTANAAGRQSVLAGIYNSQESANRRVVTLFQHLLGRAPDANALSYFSSQAIMYGDEYVIRLITETPEYISRAAQRFPVDAGTGGTPLQTVSPPSPAVATTTATSFVNALYQDLQGTKPDGATVASLVSQLATGTGYSGLASSLYESSSYRTVAVSRAYQVALGRSADSGGLAYWVGATAIPASQITGEILLTDEAYTKAGGSAAAWVRKVFNVLLGRPPTSDDLSYWSGQVDSVGRGAVLSTVYSTYESRIVRVNALFQQLLRRSPNNDELARYTAELSTVSDEYVGAELIGTSEYETSAETRFPPAVLVAIARDLLGTNLDAPTLSSWIGALASGTTPYRLAYDTYNGVAHRRWAITNVYRSLLGREPDSSGLSYWLSVTAPGGSIRTSAIQEQFLLSDELYQRAGSTPEGWVSLMYQIELGRAPDGTGLAYWANQVSSVGRSSVLWGIYNSDEAAHLRINHLALTMLGRTATNEEYDHYTPLIKAYGDEYVGEAFIGTIDYAWYAAARFG